MPEFRRVPENERERYFLKRGQMDLTAYEAFLSGLKEGDVAEVQLQADDTVRATKRRLTVAAKSLGKKLQYSQRADQGAIVFRVK